MTPDDENVSYALVAHNAAAHSEVCEVPVIIDGKPVTIIGKVCRMVSLGGTEKTIELLADESPKSPPTLAEDVVQKFNEAVKSLLNDGTPFYTIPRLFWAVPSILWERTR